MTGQDAGRRADKVRADQFRAALRMKRPQTAGEWEALFRQCEHGDGTPSYSLIAHVVMEEVDAAVAEAKFEEQERMTQWAVALRDTAVAEAVKERDMWESRALHWRKEFEKARREERERWEGAMRNLLSITRRPMHPYTRQARDLVSPPASAPEGERVLDREVTDIEEQMADYHNGYGNWAVKDWRANVNILLTRLRAVEGERDRWKMACQKSGDLVAHAEQRVAGAKAELAREVLTVSQGQLELCSTPCREGECWGCDVTRVLIAALTPPPVATDPRETEDGHDDRAADDEYFERNPGRA